MPSKPKKSSKHKLKPHLQSLHDKAQLTAQQQQVLPPASASKDAPTQEPIFFFRPVGLHGYLCQWYPSEFTDPDTNESFTSAEQYMMYHKALTFNDADIATQIMQTDSPRKQKGLAKKVNGFDDVVWSAVKKDVVERGNMLKFEQNEELMELLLQTGDMELVEASPFDRVWGIGFREDAATRVAREEWGCNLLGKCLMRVRSRLRVSRQGQSS